MSPLLVVWVIGQPAHQSFRHRCDTMRASCMSSPLRRLHRRHSRRLLLATAWPNSYGRAASTRPSRQPYQARWGCPLLHWLPWLPCPLHSLYLGWTRSLAGSAPCASQASLGPSSVWRASLGSGASYAHFRVGRMTSPCVPHSTRYARMRAAPRARRPTTPLRRRSILTRLCPTPPLCSATTGTIRTRGPLSCGRRYDLHREWRRRPLYTPQTAPRLRASTLNHVDLVAQRHLLQLSHGANALAAGVCDELGHRLDRPRVFTRTPPNRRRAPAVRSHRLYRSIPARGASARRLIFVLR